MYDFSSALPRPGNNCSKRDAIKKVYGVYHDDMIPMWVADMDFTPAPAIQKALKSEIEQGFYGYYADTGPVDQAIVEWLRTRHDWTVAKDAIRYTHGVISGYGDVIQAFSDPGQGVIVFAPVYHAFYRQIEAMGRKVVTSELVLNDGRYEMDLEALGDALTGDERIVTFCSPHNPGGRLWSEGEIRALAEFCRTHDLILCSDEIHMDLVHPGHKHIPTLVAAPEAADRTVVLTAASKGFNVAGMETGFMVVPDPALMDRLAKTLLDRESTPNRFGMASTRAAFTEGSAWSDAVCELIADHTCRFTDRVGALPGVSVMDMPSTYLIWVDFRDTGLTHKELMDRMLNDARVVPNPGPQFGAGGEGWLRFNLALSTDDLEDAIARIEKAFADIQ